MAPGHHSAWSWEANVAPPPATTVALTINNPYSNRQLSLILDTADTIRQLKGRIRRLDPKLKGDFQLWDGVIQLADPRKIWEYQFENNAELQIVANFPTFSPADAPPLGNHDPIPFFSEGLPEPVNNHGDQDFDQFALEYNASVRNTNTNIHTDFSTGFFFSNDQAPVPTTNTSKSDRHPVSFSNFVPFPDEPASTYTIAGSNMGLDPPSRFPSQSGNGQINTDYNLASLSSVNPFPAQPPDTYIDLDFYQNPRQDRSRNTYINTDLNQDVGPALFSNVNPVPYQVGNMYTNTGFNPGLHPAFLSHNPPPSVHSLTYCAKSTNPSDIMWQDPNGPIDVYNYIFDSFPFHIFPPYDPRPVTTCTMPVPIFSSRRPEPATTIASIVPPSRSPGSGSESGLKTQTRNKRSVSQMLTGSCSGVQSGSDSETQTCSGSGSETQAESDARATSGVRTQKQTLTMHVIVFEKENELTLEVYEKTKVVELRKKLELMREKKGFELPEQYFFIHMQDVMDERYSFRWHGLRDGDTVEVFPGEVQDED